MYKKQLSFLILIFFLILSVDLIPQGSCNLLNKQYYGDNEINENLPSVDSASATFIYKVFYFGRVANVVKSDDLVEFDSVRLFRYVHIRATDGSFWTYSISHYEDSHHFLKDYHFIGILTNSFICGRFSKTI